MTLVERIAAAIAASRTGAVDEWRSYRAEAQWTIDTVTALAADSDRMEPRPFNDSCDPSDIAH